MEIKYNNTTPMYIGAGEQLLSLMAKHELKMIDIEKKTGIPSQTLCRWKRKNIARVSTFDYLVESLDG